MIETEELQQTIKGCIRNERASQEKLYKQFYVPLFCLCRRIFQNDHEAIEAVNDGMMKTFEKIGSYQPAKGRFFNWLYTIVRNTALDKVRSAVAITSRAGELEDAEGEEEAAANPLASLEEKDVYVLLDRLSPATRVIFDLFYVEGYIIRDIAEQLAISMGTVKWHLSDGRKKLRSLLEKHVNE